MRKFARDSDIIGGEGKSPQGLGAKDWTKVRCRDTRINPQSGALHARGEGQAGIERSRVGGGGRTRLEEPGGGANRRAGVGAAAPDRTLRPGGSARAPAAGIVALVVHYRARIRATPFTISALLWIAWNVYWSVAAKKTASSVRSESARSRAFHQYLLLLAFFLLFAPLPLLDRRLLPPGAIWVVLGLALQVGFFGLAISARRTLGRNWSGAITEKVDHELIRSGPYRFVRHPIYTAIIGMFLGAALVSGDAHAFLAVAVIVVAYRERFASKSATSRKSLVAATTSTVAKRAALIPWVL